MTSGAHLGRYEIHGSPRPGRDGRRLPRRPIRPSGGSSRSRRSTPALLAGEDFAGSSWSASAARRGRRPAVAPQHRVRVRPRGRRTRETGCPSSSWNRAGRLTGGRAQENQRSLSSGDGDHGAGLLRDRRSAPPRDRPRDIKPANIFLDDRGRVKVGDTSAWRASTAPISPRPESASARPATPRRKSSRAGCRRRARDVFALGVWLSALHRHRVVQGTVPSAAARHPHAEPPPPGT